MLPGLLRSSLGALCRLGLAIGFGLCYCTSSAGAQAATHQVSLTWTDALNPTTGTTYNVYRATGLCSGTPTFSKIATALPLPTAAAPYVDTTVTPGAYCYAVSATVNGVESALSTSVNPPVPAFIPTALAFTVQ